MFTTISLIAFALTLVSAVFSGKVANRFDGMNYRTA